MSELVTNKISPVTGTNVTLGDSGDTFTIASGASISGDGSNLTGIITKSSSDPTGSTNPSGGVGTVFLNTTSGEMFSLTDATAGSNVWTNIGDGTGAAPVTYMAATGGTITTVGNFKLHTFNSSSTFTPTTLGDIGTVEYLVIAGGAGAGGTGQGAGGGGAGGYRNSYASENTGGGLSTESVLSVSATSYSITVGAGGAGGPSTGTDGTSGSNSVFSTIDSTGGGGGGGLTSSTGNGLAGGSGGGAGGQNGTIGSGTAGQGFNGGLGATSNDDGGGGGGAASVGENSPASNQAGDGGTGINGSITGSSVGRGGGGSGGGNDMTSNYGVGTHGGASQPNSNDTAGLPGTVNTGGGGSGGTANSVNTAGGAGGSGVVIIRYQFQA